MAEEIDRTSPLRDHLVLLEETARENERALGNFFTIELALLSATTLPEMLRVLVNDVGRLFGVDALSIAMDDADSSLAGLLTLRGDTSEDWPQLLVGGRFEARSPLYEDLQGPWLGPFNADLHDELFPADATLGSVACVPMMCRGVRSGVLNLAAADPARYHEGLATDFLARFARVLALAIENVATREQLLLTGLIDVLTGLPNRRYFLDRLDQELSRAARYGTATSVVYVDADRFKAVNDQFGHGVGDGVLREIGKRLRQGVRNADVPARLGGEEFGLLLPQTEGEDARDLAERIRIAVAAVPVSLERNLEVGITASFGVASVSGEAAREALSGRRLEPLARALVSGADRALLEAKNSGRNRVVLGTVPDEG